MGLRPLDTSVRATVARNRVGLGRYLLVSFADDDDEPLVLIEGLTEAQKRRALAYIGAQCNEEDQAEGAEEGRYIQGAGG